MFRLNSLRLRGSPLPQQGEEEGGDSSEITRRAGLANPSPPAFAPLRRGMQSSPLLRGERREKLRRRNGRSFWVSKAFHIITNLRAVAPTFIAALLVAAGHAG